MVEKNPPFGSPLMEACLASHDELLDPLLEADPTLWQLPHFAGILPLEESLMVAKPHMAEVAMTKYREIMKGLPPNAPRFLKLNGRRGFGAAYTQEEHAKSKGAFYLLYAVNHIGDTRIVKMLLDMGCDPNGDCSCAWGNERSKLPKLLLETVAVMAFERAKSPPDVLMRFANMKCGPLHLACLAGNLGAVRMLLEHGAKPDDSTNHWRMLTPMHCAATCGHAEVIEALLKHAPDGVNLACLKDKKGKTPAQRAAKRGFHELAQHLKQLAGAATSTARGAKAYQVAPDPSVTEAPPKE